MGLNTYELVDDSYSSIQHVFDTCEAESIESAKDIFRERGWGITTENVRLQPDQE
jgi:hypothetical protein